MPSISIIVIIAIYEPHAILSSKTIHKVSLLLPTKNSKNDYWYCQSKTNNYQQHFGVNDSLSSFNLLTLIAQCH
jgi:hypothetical protein